MHEIRGKPCNPRPGVHKERPYLLILWYPFSAAFSWEKAVVARGLLPLATGTRG